jgi:ribonucleoside-diphosphate reductase alpha subunit
MSYQEYVIKRNGQKEIVSFDKILRRLTNLGKKQLKVNYTNLVKKIVDMLYDEMPTDKIDELTAQECASMITTHPDYGVLASRILISNHHKKTSENYKEIVNKLYNNTDIHGVRNPIVSDQLFNVVNTHHEKIQNMLHFSRDYSFDYFGFKTLERAYLQRINGVIVERPQHMWMRVAIALHKNDLDKVKETYDLLSLKYFTHATPTLYNAGTPRQQLSSCYLLAMEKDSIDGIYSTLTDCAQISKWAGGIGLHIHNIRASGSKIRGTNGTSNGIVPMLRVFNNTARYVDQCILPETYIYTTDGPKEIQHCQSNKTSIFTTKGVEPIENVLEHSYNGEILSINGSNSFENLNITPEHPIYCLKNCKKMTNYSTIKNRLEKGLIKPEWCDAKDLTLDDMMIFNIPNYEVDNKKFSQDDCYFYGLMLGHGSMINKSTTSYISLNSKTKIANLEFIKTYLEQRYIRYFITSQDNTTRISWNKSVELPFRYSTIYNETKEKYIHPDWLNLPLYKAEKIVKGLIDSDGCKHNEITFYNTSRVLVEGIRYILLRMGIPTGGYIRNRSGESNETIYGDTIENKKIAYCLKIQKTERIANLLNVEKGEFKKYFTYNNQLFTRITSIETDKYEGTLYDLQMKDTHNYMIHNGIVHNGGGKRNGSFAIYLEPWHKDIRDFLDMKKTHGDEEMRARDLFYGLWIPDLFMHRVKTGGTWTLMCPDECPGLSDVYGDQFKELYESYEEKGMGIQVKAREIWFKILDSQIETGTPYMLYKDACNIKSNQKNLGTIKSSNLCTEIIEYSDDKETAVCNLASINLSIFVEPPLIDNVRARLNKITLYTKDGCSYCKLAKQLLKKNNLEYHEINIKEDNKETFKAGFKTTYKTEIKTFPAIIMDDEFIGGFNELLEILRPVFNYKKLHYVTGVITENLNKVININYYPTEKTSNSNLKHRPIGLGVQGLADAFMLMDLPFDSPKSREINEKIFETIYFAAVQKSCELAEKQDKYSSFDGSPASEGILSFDLWNYKPKYNMYRWDLLKERVKQFGLKNSLLVAPMPTASTSQILGNNECFEPYTSNIYVRRTNAGEFVMANKHLLKELCDLGMWTEENKNNIIKNNGSVQDMDIPKHLKEKYKIVWEMPMKSIIDMAADRAPFIDQSMSMNLWMKNPTYDKLTAMHFYSHSKKLKTGMYYLRTKAKAAPQQFTIDPSKTTENTEEDGVCETCSA